MGHQRLGRIAKSRKWKAVVDGVMGGGGAFASEADVGRIAALTLDAAGPALQLGKGDVGLQYTFFLLTQIALAARRPDWRQRLSAAGINLSADASLFDLTSELHGAIDGYVQSRGVPSDISEMAQQAAGEALSSLAKGSVDTLFGSGGEHLQRAVRDLSTKTGFARLGQVFFGRFLTRFLNFYLSRVTAGAVGGARVPSIAEVSRFNTALELHCEQSARIVRDFCGQWYSKTEYLEGISADNSAGFAAHALQKLADELGQQRMEL